MSLLRRPHDHRRNLRARRRTPRPANHPKRGEDSDAMTPVTALHRPPAGRPRFRRHLTVAPAPPKTGATQPGMLKSPGREPQRRTTTDGDHRSTADYAGQRILHGTGRTIKSP